MIIKYIINYNIQIYSRKIFLGFELLVMHFKFGQSELNKTY